MGCKLSGRSRTPTTDCRVGGHSIFKIQAWSSISLVQVTLGLRWSSTRFVYIPMITGECSLPSSRRRMFTGTWDQLSFARLGNFRPCADCQPVLIDLPRKEGQNEARQTRRSMFVTKSQQCPRPGTAGESPSDGFLSTVFHCIFHGLLQQSESQ